MPGGILLPAADLVGVVARSPEGRSPISSGLPQPDPQFVQHIPQVDPDPVAALGQQADELRRVGAGLGQPGRQDFLTGRLGEEFADIAPVARIILAIRTVAAGASGRPGDAAGPVRADHITPRRAAAAAGRTADPRPAIGLIQPVDHQHQPASAAPLPARPPAPAATQTRPGSGPTPAASRPAPDRPARNLVISCADRFSSATGTDRPPRVAGEMRQVPARLDQPRREGGLAQPCLSLNEHIPARVARP